LGGVSSDSLLWLKIGWGRRNFWIALIAKNGIGVITAEGDYVELFTDINSEGLKKWLKADEHLTATPNDLVDCYCFRSPVPGVNPF
jgi:hypothetical protein